MSCDPRSEDLEDTITRLREGIRLEEEEEYNRRATKARAQFWQAISEGKTPNEADAISQSILEQPWVVKRP